MVKKSIGKGGASSRLEIRLPYETKQKLIDMCGNQFTTSEMLRQIIERGEVPDLTATSVIREKKAVLEPLIIELARIGNNLNQISRSFNATHRFFSHYKNNNAVNIDSLALVALQRLDDEIANLSKTRESLNILISDLIEWSNQNAS